MSKETGEETVEVPINLIRTIKEMWIAGYEPEDELSTLFALLPEQEDPEDV